MTGKTSFLSLGFSNISFFYYSIIPGLLFPILQYSIVDGSAKSKPVCHCEERSDEAI